jgi:AcrR family transcriptional regulator
MENRYCTKSKILAAAQKLFAKRGYALTSLDDIAAKVSIAKPSLFYHFKNKENIYASVVKDSFARVISDLERYLEESRSGRNNLEKMIVEVIEKRLNDETVIRLVDMKTIGLDQKTSAGIRANLHKMHDLARRILENYGVRNADLAAEVLANSIHCYVLHANCDLSAITPKKYGAYLASLFFNDSVKSKNCR